MSYPQLITDILNKNIIKEINNDQTIIYNKPFSEFDIRKLYVHFCADNNQIENFEVYKKLIDNLIIAFKIVTNFKDTKTINLQDEFMLLTITGHGAMYWLKGIKSIQYITRRLKPQNQQMKTKTN